MKITFSGTPESVIREMKEYIARMSLEMSEDEAPAPKPVPPKPTEHVPPVEVQPPGEVQSRSEPASSERACRFCARYTGEGKRLAKHERHCKLNPDRVPSPLDGRPMNPGLRAHLDRRRDLRRSLQSASENSASSVPASSPPADGTTAHPDLSESTCPTSSGDT